MTETVGLVTAGTGELPRQRWDCPQTAMAEKIAVLLPLGTPSIEDGTLRLAP